MRFPVNLNLLYPRDALRVGIAVLVAVIINHYVAFSQTGWLILAAFFTSQTNYGTAFRQSILFFLLMLAAIVTTALLRIINNHAIITYACITVIYISSTYLALINRPFKNETLFFVLLFPLTLVITLLSPVSLSPVMHDQVIDILIGTIIGALCRQFIFPVSIDKEFQLGVKPLLAELAEYSLAINQFITHDDNNITSIVKKKIALENLLCQQYGTYPEWVYANGFNPGLRAGLRFFLLHLEYIIDIFFSLEYFATQHIPTDLLALLSPALAQAMHKNTELLTLLTNYFTDSKLQQIDDNFMTDITQLEDEIHRIVPSSLEFLAVSPDYLAIIALVRNIKDIRKLLLELLGSVVDYRLRK